MLERYNLRPNKFLCQKTNHDSGKDFVLANFSVKGFVEDEDVRYVIGVNETNNDLYVLTLASKSELSYE